ncbi:hypothetical protein [Brevibacillus choshinensis]|uniref:hypothetical protein n=1 Tax=Brevibacillus choshinensis TaxID=54911 RepID=UPI002E21A969|nr:hypothetical protein [Brevibacillus choshinensis]MED4784877.1 hypothetical protein [Brevibacillus choshinensis]
MADKLDELLKWEKRPLLDGMLDEGINPNKCAEWLRSEGFPISTPTVYTYAKRRKRTIYESITREGTGSARELDPETKKFKKQSRETFPVKKVVTKRSKTKVKSELELLDYVIQRGMDAIVDMEDVPVSPNLVIKAIEVKNKITGGSHNSLTVYGFEEIRIRETARERAILNVLLRYVPDDKREECVSEMERVTREYYESVGLGEVYRAETEE